MRSVRPREHRSGYVCLGRLAVEHGRPQMPVFGRLEESELSEGAGTTGVDNTLGNALVIEMHDLLAQHEVFQQGGATQRGFQGILVVGDHDALVGGQRRVLAAGVLVQFAALARLRG